MGTVNKDISGRERTIEPKLNDESNLGQSGGAVHNACTRLNEKTTYSDEFCEPLRLIPSLCFHYILPAVDKRR